MKKIIYILILMLLAVFVPAQSIEWETSYKKAFSQAENQDRNIFVLITAPSWCGPCQILEKQVWTDPAVIKFINENFIPLRLEDTINGKRNPELDRFSFSGYPTMFVYTRNNEKLITFVGALNGKYLTERLTVFTDPKLDITFTYGDLRLPEGRLKQISILEWEYTDGKKVRKFPEVQRSDTHAILYDDDEKKYLAAPLFGLDTDILFTVDKGQTWQLWKKAE